MNDILQAASQSPRAVAGNARRIDQSTSRRHTLVVPRGIIATWRERIYLRRELVRC